MAGLAHWARTSDRPAARLARSAVRAARGFTLPVPSRALRPVVRLGRLLAQTFRWLYRVFVCEPWFKASCESHGRGVRTGDFVHFIRGEGRIVIGDDVLVEGKSSFIFSSVLPEPPLLSIGSGSYINHNCSFIVASRVSIGARALIASGVTIFDSPGHSLDRERRQLGLPPRPSEIRPVSIGDDVWICTGATIFPGVTIGDGSVIALGSVVTSDVPADSLAAGVPARVIRRLEPGEGRRCAA